MCDALDNLTDEEKDYLRTCLPTEEDLKLGFALPLSTCSGPGRRVLIAAKMQVLEGLVDDPARWVRDALLLARSPHD